MTTVHVHVLCFPSYFSKEKVVYNYQNFVDFDDFWGVTVNRQVYLWF